MNAYGIRRFVNLYTMVEWMALFFVMAVLTAIGLPVYRSLRAESFESEVIMAMSIIKTAQDRYYSKHDRFAAQDTLHTADENIGLDLSADDFSGLKRVHRGDIVMSVNHPESDQMLILWMGGDADSRTGSTPRMMAMDHQGNVYRSDGAENGDWMPGYPHKEE